MQAEQAQDAKSLKIEPVLFFSAIAVTLCTCIPIVMYQDKALETLVNIRKFFTGPLGWSFLFFGPYKKDLKATYGNEVIHKPDMVTGQSAPSPAILTNRSRKTGSY